MKNTQPIRLRKNVENINEYCVTLGDFPAALPGPMCRAGPQHHAADGTARRRRAAAPISPKPAISMAQLAGSGTALMLLV